jgi:hypothetical protein
LAAFFSSSALGTIWALSDEAARAGVKPLSAFVAAPFLALLTAPALWLLRLFPESSDHGGLRCCRRIVLGIPCGLFPAALLAALTAKAGDPGSYSGAGALWLTGPVHGFLVGLIDSMHGDADRAAAAAESPCRDDAND